MSPAPRALPSSTDTNRTTSSRPALSVLGAIAVPPTVWFVHLNVSYLLVPSSCRAGHRWFLVGVTVAALAVIVSPAVRSRRARRGRGADELDMFLGRMGIWFAALFAAATLVVGLSAAIVGPCR